MASHVVIVIKDTNASITELNQKLGNATGAEKNRLINAVIDYLAGCAMGNNAAGTVEVVTRDTDPSVGTSGSGSQEVTVNVG
jgi:hypothetical protein